MSQIRRGTDTPTIDAVFTYAVDTGEKIVNETMGDGDMGRRRTGVVEDKTMTVRDGRALRDGESGGGRSRGSGGRRPGR